MHFPVGDLDPIGPTEELTLGDPDSLRRESSKETDLGPLKKTLAPRAYAALIYKYVCTQTAAMP